MQFARIDLINTVESVLLSSLKGQLQIPSLSPLAKGSSFFMINVAHHKRFIIQIVNNKQGM